MTRVAAIDQGTNSTRLLVADVEDGKVEEVVRRSVVTRLGEGVDARHRLLPQPIARVRNVLADYRQEAEQLGAEQTLLVATSAVRDAENGEAFLGEIEWSYGFRTRLLSGDEEAELTRRGVGALDPGTLLLDVGGGSTELSTPDSRVSIDLGSVRLTERHLHSDPPTTDELDAAAAAVTDAWPELEVTSAIGVAGTVGQLAALAGTDELSLATVERLTDELAAMPLAELRRVPNLDPERAPVIVAGALIVRETLRRYGLDGLRFSVRDILDGIAMEAAAMPPPDDGDAPPGAYTCC
jgi:exopolyphosphatase / guanosine-5'-triphosphate,3'-diphosphate pyrophosphatase